LKGAELVTELAVGNGLKRSLRVRLIIAVAVVALVAAWGAAFNGGSLPEPAVGGTTQIGHKAGHDEPPACSKRAPYGKYPKKQCPSRGTDGGTPPGHMKNGKNS